MKVHIQKRLTHLRLVLLMLSAHRVLRHQRQMEKKTKVEGKAEGKTLLEFERMWSIKQVDLARKERLSKMKLLDSLLGKQEPLAEYEEALKKKLVTDLLSNEVQDE